jgi:hypothetical protein
MTLSTVSALCITQTSLAEHRDHLRHFALFPAFPDSLAGRYSCDYYWRSVTLELAPFR